MRRLSSIISLLVVCSLFYGAIPCGAPAAAQDLVPTDSLTSGSSAFVFRESAKKPQAHLSGGYYYMSEGAGGAARSRRSNAEIAKAAARRRASAAAARKRAMIAAKNRKLALSNTLAKAGETSLDAGRLDDAIKNFRASLVQNPKNERASSGLSEALTQKAGDNAATAEPLLVEAVKYDPQNAEAAARLAAIYDSRGENAKAASNYEKAIQADPDMAELNAQLGLVYIRTGEIGKAAAASQKLSERGIDTLEARMLAGLVALKNNRNDEALAAFDKVLQMDPQNVDATYYRGQAYDRLGDKDQMIASYKKALTLEPGYTPASYDLGVAYYNAGDYNNAATAYQDAVKYDPNNADARANLASTYRQLERYDEANVQYKAASATKRDGDLYSEWGYCLGKVNDWNAASNRLITANEIQPLAISDSNVSWAYYNYGVSQSATDQAAAKANYELSRTFAEKAVARDPKLDAAYLNLGSTQNKLGNFAAAVAALKSALNIHQNWVIAANQLGLGYRGLNDLTNAVATFKMVTDLDGNYTFGLFNLGEAYNASGNKKEARRINDRLRKLDPGLANLLNDVFNGKAVLDSTKQKIEQKIPKVPKIPRPF